MLKIRSCFVVVLVTLGAVVVSGQEPVETFQVWPGDPPTQAPVPGPEQVLQGRPRPFYQLTNVSVPTVSVYLPEDAGRTSAGVLVCPGGGLRRLAIEHEGIEVAQWLASRGIAAFVLKYRVPAPVQIGLQDAQRALSIIRSRAEEWSVDPQTIGTMGFSAGGEIGAWLSTHFDQRQYQPIDQHDDASCRPAFAVLVYPGGLVRFRSREVKEEIVSRISAGTPPMFFVHAFDDSCQNSLRMALALKSAGVPTELHIYQDGGHGFGARGSGHPVAGWKDAFLRWASSHGFLDQPWIRRYARDLRTAIDRGESLPRLVDYNAKATLQHAFGIQNRIVREALKNDEIAGFKGGAITEQAQQGLGIDRPLSGVLLKAGKIQTGDSSTAVSIDPQRPSLIETELGFVVAVDIGYEVLTVQQARDAVEKVVPIVEIPYTFSDRAASPLTAQEMISLNIGSDRFLMGQPQDPGTVDILNLPIELLRDGDPLHRSNSSAVKGDQWQNLHKLMNQIVAQGHTIPAGSVIISGAIGKIQAAQPGNYVARFGELGDVKFQVTESKATE